MKTKKDTKKRKGKRKETKRKLAIKKEGKERKVKKSKKEEGETVAYFSDVRLPFHIDEANSTAFPMDCLQIIHNARTRYVYMLCRIGHAHESSL